MPRRANTFRKFATMAEVQFALIGGEVGFGSWVDGVPFSVMAFTVRDGQIVAIHLITDQEQLCGLFSPE